MKSPSFLLAITVLNVLLVVASLLQTLGNVRAETELPVLRGRALQIVDEQGRVRASIGVLPAGRSDDGATHAETVLLRLITERGRPTVKIAASEPASGASFAGPTETRETYAILQARERTASLRLRSEEGKEQVVSP